MLGKVQKVIQNTQKTLCIMFLQNWRYEYRILLDVASKL